MYTCATVEQALKDQDMRGAHMVRSEILLDLHLYIRATSFERLSMTTLNISRYTNFNDDYFEHILHLYVNDECFEDHMHLFQRRLSV